MTRPVSIELSRSRSVRPTRKNIINPASYVFHMFQAHTLNLCLWKKGTYINYNEFLKNWSNISFGSKHTEMAANLWILSSEYLFFYFNIKFIMLCHYNWSSRRCRPLQYRCVLSLIKLVLYKDKIKVINDYFTTSLVKTVIPFMTISLVDLLEEVRVVIKDYKIRLKITQVTYHLVNYS